VELKHQLVQMKALECRFGQGFFISRPMEADAINAWVQSEECRAVDGCAGTQPDIRS